MTDLIKRIKKLEKIAALSDSGVSWILEDGTRVKADVTNDPILFIVPDCYGPYPSICPVAFESIEPLDPLTQSIYNAAIDAARHWNKEETKNQPPLA